jgi:hypothetical protein
VVEVLAHGDDLGRTGLNTKSAAFALVNIDPQQASIAFANFGHSMLLSGQPNL